MDDGTNDKPHGIEDFKSLKRESLITGPSALVAYDPFRGGSPNRHGCDDAQASPGSTRYGVGRVPLGKFHVAWL
jgi:hypothetical protein